MKIIIFVLIIASVLAWQSFASEEGPLNHLINKEFADQFLIEIEDGSLQQPPTFNFAEVKKRFRDGTFN